jgi:signal transduction histidine kinase
MSGQPLAVSTESVNGWFNQALLAQGFRSVLRVPLRYDHELLGVLSLASRRADAFATAPPGVLAFAEQLSVLVAAERSRLQGHLDARRGEFLASIATAQSQAEPGHGFAAAASVIAASVNADAVWLQTPETDSGWPDPVPILPHAPIGQARCRADVSQRSDDDLDRELAGQGFRSVLVVPEGQHNLICAARAPYAFSAETIALVTPAVRLVAAAHSRAVLAAGRSQVSALESAAVLIEPASGEIIDINPSAGKLLQAVRGDSLWSIAATNSALSARSRLTSATGAESFDVVIDRGGEQRTLEVYAAGAPRGLWLLTLRDATQEKLSKRWGAALQRAALAAQSAAGIGELQESIVQVLREHDLQATLDAVDGPPRATDQVTVARGWPRLELDDRVLVIEHEATSDIGEALDAFRRDVTSALERLRAEARLRETNEQLADAVAARTAELEGLYAYSRDLGEAERVEEALAIAVTHIASALGSPAAAVICLSGRHFGAGSPAGQARAETMLQELDPREHMACRGLVRGPGSVERLDVAKALVSTSRGRGLVIVELEDKPDNEQLKLLLAHASQLGATLDRLRLREEAEGSRLRSIADVVGEGIALVDAEGTVEPENAAAEELLADLRNPNGEYARQLTDLIAAARDLGEPVEREISASGRTFLGAARAIPASAGQIALTLRDVTEQRLTQERLSQSERLAALGQLVSGVAHELNNPLTGILGFAQLLQDKPLDDDARRSVETIQSEAERAGKIIQDLLSFARRREPVREAVDVNELLSRVLNIRAYDLQSDGVNVELDLAGDLPAVDGDGDQLQQVFFNVLTNAVQAVRQTASPKRIAVETRRDGDNIRVRFSDSGPGIPAEALSRVFEPFFTTKEAGEGTGLGLSISYGIVKEHGGSITVGNAPSGGALVEIVLPVRTSSAGAGSDERLPATESTPVRVLVADDEESIRAVLSRMLTDEGHQVIAVEDGAQALAVLSRENFDLVITDLKMPEINGQELYAEIKASDAAMARRVIFITGDTLNPETRAFIDSVDNPTLEKPFRLERLRELISQVLA